ncbi:MAG: cobalt-precorrin-5B (C(1))-methyltransferase CbiD [Syntrophomonadaceae bacterium]|nr:cobalt-precorrin-5B (C(1))-methyltransferase CbiD [Syntrophomonadaceae bacterium]
MERYVYKHNKRLRCGYTTGSCAAAAAQRAAALVLGAGFPVDEMVALPTPMGIELKIRVEKTEIGEDWASCAVKKDSGDDPDVTNGILVYATVYKIPGPVAAKAQITIAGGIGVGRVTREGLACPVGEAAINPVPRKMIEEQVRGVCEEFDYTGKMLVEISVPEGVRIARQTFNPRLGIVNGISILGTSGIVEPMSEQALIDTIKIEMNISQAAGAEYLVITPGNYGETFVKTNLNLDPRDLVKCSNYIGEALDHARLCQIKGVLLVGHIGKLVKLAAGIMNTHSQYGDARMEIIGLHAGLAHASPAVMEKLLNCVTADEAIMILDEAGIREQTMQSILEKVDFYIKARVHDDIEIGAIIFSNKYGWLGQTEDAPNLLKKLQKESIKSK